MVQKASAQKTLLDEMLVELAPGDSQRSYYTTGNSENIDDVFVIPLIKKSPSIWRILKSKI